MQTPDLPISFYDAETSHQNIPPERIVKFVAIFKEKFGSDEKFV